MDKPVDKITYKEGYKYQLVKPVQYQTPCKVSKEIENDYIKLERNGLLTVKTLFAWDGASGAKDTPTIMRASLFHDALCQLINDQEIPRIYRLISHSYQQLTCLTGCDG